MPKNLGPLTKSPKKRFTLSPNVLVALRQIAIGVGVLLGLAFLVAAVYYITRLPVFTITTITAAGGESIDPKVVAERAGAVLEGAYGALIPKRFFLFYPRDAMVAAVEGVERIRDVVVERSGLTTLEISYGEHHPFALWCADRSAERGTSSDACLFVNEDGYAFAAAPELSGGSLVRYVHNAVTPAVATSVLPVNDFWQTVTLTTLLETDGMFVSAVVIDAVGDVYYGLSTGGELRATLTSEPTVVAENLRVIFGSSEFAHLRDTDFHYIDLRFGNKVYVSETDISLTATSSSATSSDFIIKNTESVTGGVEPTTPNISEE
jgi:hypothetical protein